MFSVGQTVRSAGFRISAIHHFYMSKRINNADLCLLTVARSLFYTGLGTGGLFYSFPFSENMIMILFGQRYGIKSCSVGQYDNQSVLVVYLYSCNGCTVFTGITLIPLVTLVTFFALESLFTLFALESLIAFVALVTLFTLESLFALITFFTLDSLCAFVALVTFFAILTVCNSKGSSGSILHSNSIRIYQSIGRGLSNGNNAATVKTIYSIFAIFTICNGKCSCCSICEGYCICVYKTFGMSFFYRSNSITVKSIDTIFTVLSVCNGKRCCCSICEGYRVGVYKSLGKGLIYRNYSFSVCTVFSICTVFAVCAVSSNKRFEPFFNSSDKSVLNRKIINRLSVKTVLTVSTILTVSTVFSICSGRTGLTLVALVALLTGRTDKRDQPFFDRSLISFFNGKLVRALSVRSILTVFAIFTCKRCYPLFKRSRVALFCQRNENVIRIIEHIIIILIFFFGSLFLRGLRSATARHVLDNLTRGLLGLCCLRLYRVTSCKR